MDESDAKAARQKYILMAAADDMLGSLGSSFVCGQAYVASLFARKVRQRFCSWRLAGQPGRGGDVFLDLHLNSINLSVEIKSCFYEIDFVFPCTTKSDPKTTSPKDMLDFVTLGHFGKQNI